MGNITPKAYEQSHAEKENTNINFTSFDVSDKETIHLLSHHLMDAAEPEYDIGKAVEFQARISTISITVCYDTGAGGNALSSPIYDNPSFYPIDEKILEKPIKVKVGNSDIIEVTRMVKVSLKVGHWRFPLWWMVVDNLPFPALIGRPTSQRLQIGYDPITNSMTYKGQKLIPANKPFNHSYSDSNDALLAPVTPEKTTRVPGRTLTKLKLTIKGIPKGPQAYYLPLMTAKGRLNVSPGLVKIDNDSWPATTHIAIINPTCQTIKIKKDTLLGSLYYLTDEDVSQTEFIDLGHPLGPPKNLTKPNENKASKEQPKEKSNKSKESEPPRKYKNVKVGMNYFAALPKRMYAPSEQINQPTHFSKLFPKAKEWTQSQNEPTESVNTLNLIIAHLAASAPPGKSPQIPEHLVKIFNTFGLDRCALEGDQIAQLAELLLSFEDIWIEEKRKGILKRTSATSCPIETEGQPTRAKPRKTTPVADYIIWNHIKTMARRKVIRPSTSPWASPILLADKKNGKVRFCVDFRRLNEVTVKDAYPLPRMDEILATLGGSSFYSVIDLTESFWSIPIQEDHIKKTAFVSKFGLWEFLSMPYGLSNAPATQQRFIEAVLNGLLWRFCFAYIDDIICFSNAFDNHLEHLKMIFTRLREHDLLLQPAKCCFCSPTFEILGFIASKDGLKPNPKKVEAIKAYPPPRSPSEVSTFLGMVSWLRRFIPRCSAVTQYLRQASQSKKKPFNLPPEALKEFRYLQDIMTNETCVAHPDPKKQFYIHVDASSHGLGAILTQLDENGHHRVIEYASKALTKPQRNYSNPVREGLGITWALIHFKYYVYGRDPILYCDCKSLSHIFDKGSTKIPDHAMLRDWISRILQYNPKVIHKPGKLMVIPDALSRHFAVYTDPEDIQNEFFGSLVDAAMHNTNDDTLNLKIQDDILAKYWDSQNEEPPSGEAPLLPLAPSREGSKEDNLLGFLAEQQRADPQCEEMINFLSSGKLPLTATHARRVKENANQYMIDDTGILRKVTELTRNGHLPPAVLPRALWDTTIESYHDAPIGGHKKYDKLIRSLSDTYYFPGMKAYVRAYCNACMQCETNTPCPKLKAKAKPYYASYPGILVHLDCTKGPLPTIRGNTYILAIIDSFSGYLRLYPTAQPDGPGVARSLLEYICVNSMPLKIVTDNGSEFANQLMAELAYVLGLKHTFIAPYNSQCNGKVENVHKTVKTMLRAFIEDFSEDWDLLLPLVEFAVNTSQSDVTNYTPFFLHFGRHPIMPLDVIYESVYRPPMTTDEYVGTLLARRDKVFRWAAHFRGLATEKQARRQDAKNKNQIKKLALGDHVLLKNRSEKDNENPDSLARKYRPIWYKKVHRIHTDLNNGSYLVKDIKGENPPFIANVQELKRLKVRYEVDVHLHNDTISTTPVPQIPEEIFESFDDQDQDHYEICKIHEHRIDKDGIMHYKVQLKGYTKKAARWYKHEDLDAEEFVKEYHSRHPLEEKANKSRKTVKPNKVQPRRKVREGAITPPLPDPAVRLATWGRMHTSNYVT